MSEPNPEPEQIDTTDAEDAELLVADPEDYHESQRLKEIHDARQAVVNTLHDIDGYTKNSEHENQKRDLAHAVSAYIAELEPLMEAVDYDDTLPETGPFDRIREFASTLGYHKENGDAKIASYQTSVFIYRQCNRFLAEVKPLIQENESTEWEV